ncbi:Retrovirus-related Pol polyprotein from transposon 17.6 [Trichinella papuae]|uniref:RNA-directed DNA polymerase n=1 Tax=Trichinella papuae TaxID=268474 RepID=A0A0V1MKT2_9BILA|nr:Retrovirus-related Pol polyprotein from transposon 17.6 [Trichinella papuae]
MLIFVQRDPFQSCLLEEDDIDKGLYVQLVNSNDPQLVIMNKALSLNKLSIDPTAADAEKEWKFWLLQFQDFVQLTMDPGVDLLKILRLYLTTSTFEYVQDCKSYEEAIAKLNDVYVKPKNVIFARYEFISRKQRDGESLEEFLHALQRLSKNCEYKNVTAEQYREEMIQDTFINNMSSDEIRTRLLEHNALALNSAKEKAKLYTKSDPIINSVSAVDPGTEITNTSAAIKQVCYFCGKRRHPRVNCPARNTTCNNCGKVGHFAKVCKSASKRTASASVTSLICSSSSPTATELKNAIVEAKINGTNISALIDTGSSLSLIDERLCKTLELKLLPTDGKVLMASTSFQSRLKGYAIADIELHGFHYSNSKLHILPNACTDVIIGQDILQLHSNLTVSFDGPRAPLTICGLALAKIPAPSLFANLSTNCKPVAVKSRRYSVAEAKFINNEIKRLLAENIIEESCSPWRAQALVVTSDNHKKRMVIDYSQTINRFTLLDAYPLPKINDMVQAISKYRFFSTVDLKSAYYQIHINARDKPYTAFEAGGRLYQFKRIPFGVTNGVACFQRVMDNILRVEKLKDTFVYVDNVTICGMNQEEHDRNLNRFREVAEKYNLTLNKEKSSRRRVLGMFAAYSQWIPRFSEKIHTLARCTTFPLPQPAVDAFEALKEDIVNSVVTAVDDELPFTVETGASDHAIAATLSQLGKPVAFFSRIEQRHSSVEKEAYAIVEAIRKWRHYLLGHHFYLITDQRSVAFMFDNKQAGKAKNDKIMRWRLELSPYSYDIIYRPGNLNAKADALSRICSSIQVENVTLRTLHNNLCHPGVTRMAHYVRSKNLPYTIGEIQRITTSCRVCAELKPRFFKGDSGKLIKATAPFERLNIDFKGPLPSASSNRYILTVVDEYSRFPFAFPCPDISS